MFTIKGMLVSGLGECGMSVLVAPLRRFRQRHLTEASLNGSNG